MFAYTNYHKDETAKKLHKLNKKNTAEIVMCLVRDKRTLILVNNTNWFWYQLTNKTSTHYTMAPQCLIMQNHDNV